MRMRIVTFLTSAFMASVIIIAASADVKCATGEECGFPIMGRASFNSHPDWDNCIPTGENDWCNNYNNGQDRARYQVDIYCDDLACRENCGDGWIRDHLASIQNGVASFNRLPNDVKAEFSATSYCYCRNENGFEGEPMRVGNGVPVPLTFGQKIQKFIGGLFSRPTKPVPPGGRIGG